MAYIATRNRKEWVFGGCGVKGGKRSRRERGKWRTGVNLREVWIEERWGIEEGGCHSVPDLI